jgi:PEP-CTERM motif
MKRVTIACSALALTVAMHASAQAAPVQIDFNTAAFAGPNSGTVSTFTKNNVYGDLDLTFDAFDEVAKAVTLLHWDANDGLGNADGFGVVGSGYSNDEVEGTERLRLSFSKAVHLFGFNLTDFFFESEPNNGNCPAASPDCYLERGSFQVLFGNGTSSAWFDFNALPGATRNTNGLFDVALDFDNVIGILYKAPGETPDAFGDGSKKLEDFSLAGIKLDVDLTQVPEPGSLMLLGLGLTGLAARCRRRA